MCCWCGSAWRSAGIGTVVLLLGMVVVGLVVVCFVVTGLVVVGMVVVTVGMVVIVNYSRWWLGAWFC